MKLWKIYTMEDEYPGLWQQWYRQQCVAVGFAPHRGCKLRGTTDDFGGWRRCRNALLEMQIGDHVVAALPRHRVARLGTIVEKRIEDDEWNPLVLPSKTEPQGSMGRRIYVRWDLSCGPDDTDLVVALPEGAHFPNYERLPTVARIRSLSLAKLRAEMNIKGNWVRLPLTSQRTDTGFDEKPEEVREHYVAYHSASRMGRQYKARGARFGFSSWKPEAQLRKAIGQSVWVITSDGQRPSRYFLAGFYTPNTIEAAGDGWEVWGRGTRCEPHIDVTRVAWFNVLRKEQNNFSFGFNRIRSPEVINALSRYANGFPRDSIFPDEVPSYSEGMGMRVMVNRYERDSAARAACLKEFGTACFVCKTELSGMYGEIAAGLIHVHHLKPISAMGQEYKVDPTRDLIPICPNCHAVAHRRDPPLSPKEIRNLLRKRRGNGAGGV